jgi:hypothetical protein
VNRRTLLATVGAGVAGLAGCSDAVEEFAPTEEGETTTRRPPGRPTDGTVPCSETGWGYELGGPPVRDLPEPTDSFEGYDCPTFEWADRTVCYQRVTVAEEDVVLVATDATLMTGDISWAGGEFVLVNRTGEVVETHPGTWTVLEPTDSGWSLVDGGDPDCLRRIEHEGIHWWSFGTDAEEINLTGVPVDLDPGVYAFAVPAYLPDGDHIMCATLFEVEAVDLEPVTPIEGENVTAVPL